MRPRQALRSSFLFSLGLLAVACSGGGSGGGDVGFQLTTVSLQDGDVWEVNREIVFTFNEDVDFSSVSLNTINIQTVGGEPATGTFTLRGTRQVVFQPNCPRQENRLDTGLRAGNVDYVIRVTGRSSGSINTVRSTSAESLQVTQVRNFETPPDDDDEAFLDTESGPPTAVVRPFGSGELNATYIEVGGNTDPASRIYFERDALQNLVLSQPGFVAPLNLYSDPATRIALVIEFNQSISPSSTNLSEDRVRLEFQDAGGNWIPLDTLITLVANCVDGGAKLRLEPIGGLPQDRPIRGVVKAQFEDLVGQPTQQDDINFAIFTTDEVGFSSLNPPTRLSDELKESFDFGGESPLSLEDTDTLFVTPPAQWKNGKLQAAFDFDGTGGPNGTFDWEVAPGDTPPPLDTDSGSIVATDGVTVQLVRDGVIHVRNMTIGAGAIVRVQGQSPLQIHATGTVIIRGTLDLSGFDARDVVVANSGNVTELGAQGGPGGGDGGNANDSTASSTARGGAGQGPGAEINAGGKGGETGFAAPALLKSARRPGGGGGGRFAAGTAEAGFNGAATAIGAQSRAAPAAGGAVGTSPFKDGSLLNDFFGTRAVGTGIVVDSLVQGELTQLWGGYGGGGGGNANPATDFPSPNWTPATDEKGAAGGGGGGGLHIRALGAIQFGAAGTILCNGGRGGVGENVELQDHIGGNGGSGSGGHIILETASFIDFTDANPASTTPPRDWVRAVGGPRVTGATTTSPNISWGGAGGPGVIQLHVPNSLAAPDEDPANSDIIVPAPVAGAPDPIDAFSSPKANILVPAFSATSKARSKWISIGGADQNSSGVPTELEFLFQGIDINAGTEEGKILVTGDSVQELAPLIDLDQEGNPDLAVLPDRVTVRVSGGALAVFDLTTNGVSNDLYLRTPALLEEFVLRLSAGAAVQDFTVSSASYVEGAVGLGDERLDITVADTGADLQDFIDANTAQGVVHLQLVPRFFEVVTGGSPGVLPSTGFIRVLFQATGDDGTGAPDEASPLVDWTADIAQFNQQPAGAIQFFRYEVEFELAEGGAVSAGTQPTSLEFLRIPFVF